MWTGGREAGRAGRQTRMFLASLLTLLALAQAILGPGTWRPNQASGGPGGLFQLSQAPCGADASPDQPEPGRGHKALSCCIVCIASAADAHPLRLPELVTNGLAHVRATSGPPEALRDRPAKRPSGWGSAWSAQAPPNFS